MNEDDSVPKADGLNYDETKMTFSGSSRGLFEGVKPNYKRKRSWHRALKRGAVWALMEAGTKAMWDRLNKDMYSQIKDTVIYNYAPRGFVYFLRKNDE